MVALNPTRAEPVSITVATATGIVRKLFLAHANVLSIRPLSGGVMSTVLEWTLDRKPWAVVAKLRPEPDYTPFLEETRALSWFRQNTQLPVPEPLGWLSSVDGLAGTCLLLERMPGRHLGEAKLSATGRRSVQVQLAKHVARLHHIHRSTYGSAMDPESDGQAKWHDYLQPRMRDTFEAVRDRVSSAARWAIDEVILNLPRFLPEFGEPTLVHGDLWANNIVVDDRHPDRPIITAFIDCAANFRDVEYEIAYLMSFGTVSRAFFSEYQKHHVLFPGLVKRARVYDLYFKLSHMRTFDDTYRSKVERLAIQLAEKTKR